VPLAQIATPLLYLAAALGLAAACHRWVLPLGRRTVLALVLLPLCFTGRALLTGGVYSPITSAYANPPFEAVRAEVGLDEPQVGHFFDLYGQIVPWHRAVRHAWSQGEWPLRNPFLLCGDLLAGTAQPAPFYPPNLLSLLLPLPLALTFLASFHFFLAALGGYLFARDLDCRPRAAIFAAAGWMAMNGTVFWIGWPIGMVMPMLPLVLVGARRLAREPGARSCLLLTAALGAGALAGHPETSGHHVAIAGVYGLWEALRGPRSAWPRILGWGAAAAALTVGLTAIALLPIADALPQTQQWYLRRLMSDRGAESWREVWLRLLPNLVPFVHGGHGNQVPGLPRFIGIYSGAYAGSLLVVPALYGLARSTWPGRWLLAGFGLIGLAAWVRLPGFYEALGRIPPFDVSVNHRLIALTGIALAVLAALGVEAWCRRERPPGLGRLAAAVLAILVALVAALWPTMRTGGLEPGFLLARSALYLLPVAAALPFLLARRLRPLALAALLGLLLVQRVGEIGGLYPNARLGMFYPPIAPLDSPRLDREVSRVVGAGYTLIPNQSVHYGLEDVRGYQALHHRRFARLNPLWVSEGEGHYFYRVDDLSRPFLSFLNVRWALVPPGRRPPRFWRRVEDANGVVLWRNRRALDRAFLPARVRLASRPEQVLREMAAARDFSQVAWIETADPLFAHPFEVANGPGTVALERRGLGYRLAADLHADAWIVISEVAWRGWRAESDGRDLPLAIANHAFLGLRLPAGEHTVDLSYRPRAFYVGLTITAGTLGVLVLAGLGGAWHRRLRPATKPRAGGPPVRDPP